MGDRHPFLFTVLLVVFVSLLFKLDVNHEACYFLNDSFGFCLYTLERLTPNPFIFTMVLVALLKSAGVNIDGIIIDLFRSHK